MTRTRPTLTIDQAVPEDLPALEAIRRASLVPMRDRLRERLGEVVFARTQAGADEAQAALLEARVRGEGGWKVLVGRLRGRAVGFLALHLDDARGVGQLDLFAVVPDERGRGIGGALVDTALTRMRLEGIDVATVVTAEDPVARGLFARAGFALELPGARLARQL